MRLKGELNNAKALTWSSKAEMVDVLKSACTWFHILDDRVEGEAHCEGILFDSKRNLSKATRAGIGVVLAGTGVEPVALGIQESKCLWIGYNSMVALVDFSTETIVERHELDWVFYDMFRVSHGVLVLNELGATLFSIEGGVRWSYSTDDILENYSISDMTITLKSSKGTVSQLDITTGKILSPVLRKPSSHGGTGDEGTVEEKVEE